MDTDVMSCPPPRKVVADRWRHRTPGNGHPPLVRLLRRGATVAAVAVATVALGAAPAFAAPKPSPNVTCIRLGPNSTYQAVFGYNLNGKSGTTIPVGANNAMTPSSMDGVQITDFSPGSYTAVFATDMVPSNQSITWTLNGAPATATSNSTVCGPNVSLPAEGNGIGPVLVIATSVLLSLAPLYLRRWRARRRSA